MNAIKFILLFMGILFSSNACKKEFFDDKLSLKKEPYNGNQLRIDGYYYQISDGKIYTILFLYRNGVVMYGGGEGVEIENIEEREINFIDKSWIESVKKFKSWWGLFQIDSDNIKIERWYSSSGGGLPAYLHSGIILNDTTFVMKKSVRTDGTNEREINKVYHFKQFSPKPDSTNKFIP